MPRQPPAVIAPGGDLDVVAGACSIAGNASRPISVTTAPTMPVAVAKIAQVTMRRHRERARDARQREVQALEQLLDQVRALDQVAHEHEQRDRDQHVVRHHRVGALHHEVERSAAIGESPD